MYSNRQLKYHLEEISNGAKFTKFEYETAENFTITLKCKIEESDIAHYNNYTKQWIRKFSEFTNTAWIVCTCFPHLKRLAYRKLYCCHRSAQNKTKASERSRNLGCKAKIDFKIKLINKYTKRNDPDLREGLNMNISVAFHHSHLVNATEAYNMLKSSSRSDSAFYEYFNDGYPPAAAKVYHELLLTEKYGRDNEYIANASVNPTLRHIIYIFHKNKHNVDGDVIQRKVNTLQQTHTIKYNTEPQFIAIVTPLMGRVITQLSIDHLLVDVTSLSGGPHVMFIYVPSQVGSLPIACAIHMKQSEDIYGEIFQSISSAIEKYAKCFEPESATVNNLLTKNALKSMFHNIVIKLDRHGICREFWEWTCCGDNNINKKIRHDVMILFKSLIYAKTIEEATEIHNDLINNKTMLRCVNKLEYVWTDHEHWITKEGNRGHNNEANIIFIKEILMQKCKSFTFTATIDVVTKILENHFQKIILASLDNEVTALYTKFLPKANIELSSAQTTEQTEFKVPCEVNNKIYRANIDTLCCDCKTGLKGRICEHLTGVLNITNKYNFKVSEEDKHIYVYISGKLDIVKQEFDDIEVYNETPITDRPMSTSSRVSDYEMKKEDKDPLEENSENMATENDSNSKAQYETAMKALNDEFRRLNKLFKEHPNEGNLDTMRRLTKELGKIRPVEKVDLSNLSVQLNP